MTMVYRLWRLSTFYTPDANAQRLMRLMLPSCPAGKGGAPAAVDTPDDEIAAPDMLLLLMLLCRPAGKGAVAVHCCPACRGAAPAASDVSDDELDAPHRLLLPLLHLTCCCCCCCAVLQARVLPLLLTTSLMMSWLHLTGCCCFFCT
jgi:hypothetical protein